MKLEIFLFLLIIFSQFLSADSIQFQSYYGGNSQLISSNSYGLENSPYSSIEEERISYITGDVTKESEKDSSILIFVILILLIFIMIIERKSIKRFVYSKGYKRPK